MSKFIKKTIGNATVYCGDFLEVLPYVSNDFDSIVTDPPYGIGSIMKGGTWGSSDVAKSQQRWDSEACQEWVDSLILCEMPTIIWGGHYYIIPPSRCWLVWNKPSITTMADAELAWTNLEQPTKTYNHNRLDNSFKSKEHPSQKPIKLMKWCIGFLKDSETIFDPFMGSGSTGVAALQLNKKFIGIERDKDYFDLACRRIEETEALKNNYKKKDKNGFFF